MEQRLDLGQREVTDGAQVALQANGMNAETLFARQEMCDWGEESEWMKGFNDKAVPDLRSGHVFRSRYRLPDGAELYAMTAFDRSQTLLLRVDEYQEREIGIQEGYGVWADVYDAYDNPLIAIEEPQALALIDALPPFATVADVGTGTGRYALKLAQRAGVSVDAFDATPEMLAVAERFAAAQNLANIRFYLADVTTPPLPAPSNHFDLLTCGLMLCHVPDIYKVVASTFASSDPAGISC